MDEKIRILCAADTHLGRTNVHYRQNSWDFVVETALNKGADAIILSGDIIDHEGDFFEAGGHLERGLLLLGRKNIAVIAVAGNHDEKVLAKVFRTMRADNFYLLQGDGWQTLALTLKGMAFRFDGRSFDAEKRTENYFSDYDLPLPANEIAIGLLHCDVNYKESVYAPVTDKDFVDKPQKIWVLGHVHKPQEISSQPLVFYAGSPLPHDHGEEGLHSIALLEFQKGGRWKRELQIAPLCYLMLEVDIANGLEEALMNAVFRLHDSIKEMPVKKVGCNVALMGSTEQFGQIDMFMEKAQAEFKRILPSSFGEIEYFISSIENRARPALDLKKLKLSPSLTGLLAGELLKIEENDLEVIEQARQVLQQKREAMPFAMQMGTKISLSQTRDYLLRSGYLMLEKLLAQQEVL